jgi:subtilase family serine protease
MSTTRQGRRGRAWVAVIGLLSAAAVAVSPASATAAAGTRHGTMSPAIGTHPSYRVVGHTTDDPAATTFSCQLTTPAGCYGPSQIRAAYGFDKVSATGAGRTIVIVDAFQSPTIEHDLSVFDQLFGLPDPTLKIIAPDGLTPFDQTDANMVGWAGEITLDVEWAHAIAPAATLKLVLAKSNEDADILSATRYAVDHNLGDVISQSFGEAEQCMDPKLVAAQHRLFAAATLKHITLLASSGDQGAAQPSCDGTGYIKAASTPASDPLVTGVGGTRLFADGVTGAYQSETAWNEPDFESATGGGFSILYDTPLYQRPLRLPSRGVPDVAYNAAIIGGVLTVWSSSGQGENLVFRFGGTSAGTPQWAGLTALVNQSAGQRIGFLNLVLYAAALTPAYSRLFHDVTSGDNSSNGVTGFPAKTGWDATTGLGSPKANALIPLLASAARHSG